MDYLMFMFVPLFIAASAIVTLGLISSLASIFRGKVDCVTKSKLQTVVIYSEYSSSFIVDMDYASGIRGFDVFEYGENRIGSCLVVYQLGVF